MDGGGDRVQVRLDLRVVEPDCVVEDKELDDDVEDVELGHGVLSVVWVCTPP